MAPASAEAVFGVAPWAPPGVAPLPGNEFLVSPLFLASQFRPRFLAWLLLVWPVLLARLFLVWPLFLAKLLLVSPKFLVTGTVASDEVPVSDVVPSTSVVPLSSVVASDAM